MIKKLSYSAGSLATTLAYQSFSAYIIFFYVDVVKLPTYLSALGMLIFAVWNALNDPIMGFVSDLTKTHWGRRIPYLIGAAFPFGAAYCLLWTPPFTQIDQSFLLFLYFVIFICLFDAFYTITAINLTALFPEMYPTLKERSQVNLFRQSFVMLGLLLGIALPPAIFASWGWGAMGAIIGVTITIVTFLAAWGSREKLEYERDKPLHLFQAIAATIENRSFLTFVLANFCIQYTLTIVLAGTPFFIKYVLNLPSSAITYVLGPALVAAFLTLHFWRWLEIRTGAKTVFLVSTILMIVALLPILYLHNILALSILSILVGIGFSGFVTVADIMLSDVIDEDEISTGTRREGVFFGLNAFIIRFAVILEVLSISAVFIRFGYNPYVYTQAKGFVFGLRLLMAGLPIIALFLGFLIMLTYPLAGKTLAEMDAKLIELHKKKKIASN